jgi:hypothetical protein
MMKAGDTVNIYEDPITQTSLEGRAVLVSKVKDDMGIIDGVYRMERWAVRFEGEQDKYERSILLKI